MNEPSGYTALDLIGFTDKGNYSSSANYVKNDLVHYNARVWRCLIDDTSNVTPVAGANWKIWIDEAAYLSGLADTTITNPTDGSVLRFNTATSKWINEGVDSTPTQNSNKLVKSGGVYTQLANKANTSSLATVATSGAYSDLNGKPSLATVATSGAYSDLNGKPTIPTVNNGTLTIQKNGTTVQTFTANQSSNVTANITVPTKTSDLTNDSNFVSDSSYSHITVDSAMSSSSTNPVQNKVVNTAISSVRGVAAVKTWIGTCSTAANAQKKEATVDNGFTLTDGVRVGIKFTNTNTFESSTATPITLNVNSTGDINIYYGSTHSGAGNTGKNTVIYGSANRYNYYVYDGTYWVWDGMGQETDTTYTPQKLGFGYGTCSTAEATAAKTATLASYELVKNGYVSVKFTYAVPASATLSINSKAAKPIYYHGAAITAGIINAGDMATFVYDGTNYNLVGVDNVTSQIQALTNNISKSTDVYNSSHYYIIGEYCVSPDDGTLQRCISNTSGGTWASVKDNCFTPDTLVHALTLENEEQLYTPTIVLQGATALLRRVFKKGNIVSVLMTLRIDAATTINAYTSIITGLPQPSVEQGLSLTTSNSAIPNLGLCSVNTNGAIQNSSNMSLPTGTYINIYGTYVVR